jgi:hypothetical protein
VRLSAALAWCSSTDALIRSSKPKPTDTSFVMGLSGDLEKMELQETEFCRLAKFVPAFGGVKVLEADGSLVNPARPVMLRDLIHFDQSN